MDCPSCQSKVHPGADRCPSCAQPIPSELPATDPSSQPPSGEATIHVDQRVGRVHPGGKVAGAVLNGVRTAVITVHQSIAEVGLDVVQDRRNRVLLLDKVKKTWVDGALATKEQVHARFVPGSGLIPLHKRLVPDKVDCPSAASREIAYLAPDLDVLPSDKGILDLFDDLGHSLLILGEPGAGKTTTLLQLVRDAIARAEQSPEEPDGPIPVVLNVASWENRRPSFDDWAVSEVNTHYQVPMKDVRRWLESNYLWLFLHGLDEVGLRYRDDCIDAINAFVQTHGLTGIAVCCHSEQYREADTKLELCGAIQLEPLTQQQIDAYFDAAGPKLSGLREEVTAEPSLRKLVERPLWLNVLSLTYEDKPRAEPAIGTTEVTETGRRPVWDAYIQRMFQYKVEAEKPYSDLQTTCWLAWLARRMSEHNQTTFLIEQMQPSWLLSRGTQSGYMFSSRLLVALAGGLIGGLIIGIASRLAEPWTLVEALRQGVERGLVEGLLGGAIAAVGVAVFDMILIRRAKQKPVVGAGSLVPRSLLKMLLIMLAVGTAVASLFGLVFGTTEWLDLPFRWWLWEGLTIGLIFGLSAAFLFGFGPKGTRRGLDDDIQTVELISWSRRGALSGALVGIVLAVIAGPIAGAVAGGTAYVAPWIERGLKPIWVVLATAGTSVFFLGMVGAVFGGLAGTLPTPKKIAPNQGLRLSLTNALVTGPLVGLLVGLIAFPVGYLVGGFGERGLRYAITWGLYGLFFGVLASLWYGGVFAAQHAILRLIAWFQGDTPRPGKLVDFLDYAAQRTFLEKVGGGYRWSHGHLHDHFASMDLSSME